MMMVMEMAVGRGGGNIGDGHLYKRQRLQRRPRQHKQHLLHLLLTFPNTTEQHLKDCCPGAISPIITRQCISGQIESEVE